jgi:hypothetical protein
VCPVECCVPDADHREEEVDLLQKALKIHPSQNFPALEELDDTNSRFRNPDWINADQ